MTPNEYQELALRTFNEDCDYSGQLINCALGLTGEAGEVADEIKKIYFQGHGLNKAKIANELGDIQWYISALAKKLGYTLEEIMLMNIEKLKARYPDGFDAERSVNRE